MPKYAAFLRAINVGGHTVKMDILRGLFENLGFSNVETFIASGNVLFDSDSSQPDDLEKVIAGRLQIDLGYEVVTFLRTLPEVAQIAGYPAFANDQLEGCNLYIAFAATSPGAAAAQKLHTYTTDLNEFHIHQREIYWLCRTRMSDSVFSGALMEKTLGMPLTLRNITTIQKIAEKYGDAAKANLS